jgi:hypothetical protein
VKGDKEPTTLGEFGCWLNCWGDQPPRGDHSRAWHEGYEEALRDAYRYFDALHPEWHASWSDYIKKGVTA